MLRIDSPPEGNRLSWFVYVDNNIEPRGSSTYVLSLNTWYHVAAVYNKDNGFMGFYINGELNNFRTRIGTPTLTYFNVFNIGAELRGRSPFSGIIDEVRIYNRALSESEIKQLYSGLVSPGQTATIKPLISLSKGTHTLRLCTSSMCSTAILTV